MVLAQSDEISLMKPTNETKCLTTSMILQILQFKVLCSTFLLVCFVCLKESNIETREKNI